MEQQISVSQFRTQPLYELDDDSDHSADLFNRFIGTAPDIKINKNLIGADFAQQEAI